MRLPDGDGLDLVEWMQHALPGRARARSSPRTATSNRRCARSSSAPSISSPSRWTSACCAASSSTALKLSQAADGEATTRTRHAAHRRSRRDGAAARDDPARRAQPGAGAHLRRIGHRQGTGGAHDPRLRPARRRPVRAGQLRRDSLRAHGKRVLRPQARQLHRRGRRQDGPDPVAPKAARCSSTKSRTCRCTCR